ncbi:hypothetical protein ScPMuIL_007531 [Solemya velum]
MYTPRDSHSTAGLASSLFPRLKKSGIHVMNTRSGVLELPNLLQREAMLIPDYLRIIAELHSLQAQGKDQRFQYPRMGRSGLNSLSEEGMKGMGEQNCCPVGLKSEWGFGEGEFKVDACSAQKCCSGLREFMDIKPDSTFYSLCIPNCVPLNKGLEDLKE